MFFDKATERKILSLAIRCPSDGCEWIGELRNKEVELFFDSSTYDKPNLFKQRTSLKFAFSSTDPFHLLSFQSRSLHQRKLLHEITEKRAQPARDRYVPVENSQMRLLL